MKLLLMKMDSLIEHKMSIKNVFGSEIVDLGCFSKRMKKNPTFLAICSIVNNDPSFYKTNDQPAG